MIELTTERFAGIECLHAAPAGQRQQRLPTIVFYHGFTSSKDVYAYFAVALAQAGFRTLMPDADMHGARYNGDADTRFHHFWDILKQNIDEFPLLEKALRTDDLIAGERLAVAGASMGGMTALGLMARYPHIHSAACMMGSGYFMQLSHTLFPPVTVTSEAQQAQFTKRMAPLVDYDPSARLKNLANRPLLLWHGDADEVVPFAETQRLERALREQGLDAHLISLTEQHIGHKITPSGLTALVSFFKRRL